MGHEDDDAREAARQRRIADACLLEEVAVQGRLGLYRRLIRTNLTHVARRLLPRTADAVDAGGAGRFDAWFARFLAESGPRTRYLRDVPVEFVAWALVASRSTPMTPPFLADLARHEVDLFQVESAPRLESPPPLAEVALDRPLVFATPRKLARYDHAVDELVADPPGRLTHVFIHRDEDNIVHTMRLDDARSQLLSLLLDGVPLVAALSRATTPRDTTLSDESLRDVAEWLATLGASGALLGGAG